ncbi:MAG: folate-binding protein, partial [Pseudohongiellaceae bacterium]
MENFFVDLSHLDLLCVSGEDSGKFLQGQLTCDVTQATASQSIPGAICNNKGRVLANFRLLLHQGNYYLEMNQAQLAVSKSILDKFIVFYKAET